MNIVCIRGCLHHHLWPVYSIRKERQVMHILVDGQVRRYGSVQSGIFRPKLVHLLLGCRSHRSSTAENSREKQERNSDLTSQHPEGSWQGSGHLKRTFIHSVYHICLPFIAENKIQYWSKHKERNIIALQTDKSRHLTNFL